MTVSLAFETTGNPDPSAPTALILHGILGSSQNWRGFTRRLQAQHPQWRWIRVDLRHHGGSQGAVPPNTLQSCASDLQQLCAQQDIQPRLVMGHSFGGKVALLYGTKHLETLETLWLIDSPLGIRPPKQTRTQEIAPEAVVRALRQLPGPFSKRAQLVDAMTHLGFPREIGLWMTTNMTLKEDGYHWRLNLDGISELLDDYRQQNLWPLVHALHDKNIIQHVRAANSTVWSDDELRGLQSATDANRLTAHVVPDAGHWTHTDNPNALLELLCHYGCTARE